MPFERYIHPQQHSSSLLSPSSAYDNAHNGAVDYSTFSANVQFQMPQLVMGTPTVAPGGGAEVLPAGMYAPVPLSHAAFPAAGGISVFGSSSGQGASSWMPPSAMYSEQITSSESSKFDIMPDSQSPYIPQPSYSHLPMRHISQSTMTPPLYLANRSPGSLQSIPLNMTSSLGLPVYSTSGFDFVSILSRVANRASPRVVLGPVDLTCSFVVVDTRRYDHPIVYASPTFCTLTGYEEHEVLGQNCRFLQAPDGVVQKGESRRYTSGDAVSHLKRCLVADKECQTTMLNYRKDGSAFINLVSIIPVRGGVNDGPEEADDIIYHVGFQVDLTEQPNAILQKLRDGSYIVNYSHNRSHPPANSVSGRNWRTNSALMSGASKDIRSLLADASFINSVPLSLKTTSLSPAISAERTDQYDGNKLINLLLLESTPDFIHVVSLKGSFLYVAPSVRRVLGYEPEELVGKSVTDFCHQADIVPLMRELKESSSTPALAASAPPQDGPAIASSSSNLASGPKPVDLLFRMRSKSGTFLWMECRGKLHVEPGKGRKAIILSGRVRSVPSLCWGSITRAGGLAPSRPRPLLRLQAQSSSGSSSSRPGDEQDTEFWGLLSTAGTFLFVGAAVRGVLGWGSGEVIGHAVGDFVVGPDETGTRQAVERELMCVALDPRQEVRTVVCKMRRKDGTRVLVRAAFYRSRSGDDDPAPLSPQFAAPGNPASSPAVCQIRILDPRSVSQPQPPALIVHQFSENVFNELDIARGSSWQYELQQLKFENQRLLDEVETLEADRAASVSASLPPRPSFLLPSVLQERRDIPVSRPSVDARSSWATPQEMTGTRMHLQLPMKRTWDQTDSGRPN